MIRVTVVFLASLLLSGCETLPVNWPSYSGYVAEVKPDLPTINQVAIDRLTKQGLEAEHIDRGIIVYLPPSIYFSGGKSDISLEAREKIGIIANEVNKEYLSTRQIEVLGHTNTVGGKETNMALSKKRAQAAAEELVFSKVDKSRITAMWFGENKPRFKEQTALGDIDQLARSKNRRVEFVILNPVEESES